MSCELLAYIHIHMVYKDKLEVYLIGCGDTDLVLGYFDDHWVVGLMKSDHKLSLTFSKEHQLSLTLFSNYS